MVRGSESASGSNIAGSLIASDPLSGLSVDAQTLLVQGGGGSFQFSGAVSQKSRRSTYPR